MNINYAKLQPGNMVRNPSNNRKVIETSPGRIEDPILPRWSDPNTLHRAATLSELENIDTPVAIHCGLSELIVLDFDDELFNDALALNNSLSPEYRCTNISKSVGKPGGHFMYKYAPNQLTAYIDNPNGCKLNKLDTLYGNTLVYATTRRNRTKEKLVSSDTLIEMPVAMQLMAISKYQEKKVRTVISKEMPSYAGSKLGFIAARAQSDPAYLQQLLIIVTQPRFKELMAMSDKDLWELHPDRLPDGNGYNYLLSVSGVFMKDPSISPDIHKELLLYINSLFSEPLDPNRVLSIYNRDVDSPDYEYSETWDIDTFSITGRNQTQYEIYGYYSANVINYMVVDVLKNSIKTFKTCANMLDYLLMMTGKKLKKDSILGKITEVIVIERPDKPYGKQGEHLVFNVYRQCKEQAVFYNPSIYREEWSEQEKMLPYDKNHPRWPRVTLAALKNSCGPRLSMFLSFMARKYRTREHSPLFFVFYGVPHSFKSAIVNGVFSRLSKGRHATISVEMLIEKYNAWQINKDLVLLDEVHYITAKDTKQVIQNINAISGNSTIAGIRRMFEDVDSNEYPQELTFILATNEPLKLTNEINERRMVVFTATQKVADALNLSNQEIQQAVQDETVDFAYYLANVPPLADSAYLHNEEWKTQQYHEFMENGQSYEDRFLRAIDKESLRDMFNAYVDMGGSKDKFCKAFFRNGHGRMMVRIHNTRADLASGPALFDNTSSLCDWKAMSKKLLLMTNRVSKQIAELEGRSYTGNRVVYFNADTAISRALNGRVLVRPTIENIFEIWDELKK